VSISLLPSLLCLGCSAAFLVFECAPACAGVVGLHLRLLHCGRVVLLPPNPREALPLRDGLKRVGADVSADGRVELIDVRKDSLQEGVVTRLADVVVLTLPTLKTEAADGLHVTLWAR